MSENFNKLPYDPTKLHRELNKFYLSASDKDIQEMLDAVGKKDLSEFFNHIPEDIKFKNMKEFETLSYSDLIDHMETLSKKNNIKSSFIGDGLCHYKVPEIVPHVLGIRGLTTAYTPYQPERSQGTLQTLWLYASAVSMLTGFEAINASFYERSTCLYEALCTALRLKRKTTTVLVSEGIYPDDLKVLDTLSVETGINIIKIPLDNNSGLIDRTKLEEQIATHKDVLAGFAYPQVNSLGNLEDVHYLTDLCSENDLKSIAIIDPMLLATEGLEAPAKFGSKQQGVDMIVGEGQQLCLDPQYGGPGLGIFGIRYDEKNKTAIRSTAGRFVGKAKDLSGRDCLAMILSTREQHIRRDKATSNICSNQSYISTIAGAAILDRGEIGMTEACLSGKDFAEQMAVQLTQFKDVNLAYPNTAFYNQMTLELPVNATELIAKAAKAGIHLGVDVSNRTNDNKNLLLISFTDIHNDEDLEKLEKFFKDNFEEQEKEISIPQIDSKLLRTTPVGLPNFTTQELKDFYDKLGEQNVSPDDNIYPLGSCTMKYNPYINDWAASLPGFANIHPQAPIEDAQGSIELLYGMQEMFKAITGLPGLTTEPVAGAQGELVGLKLFQAYHRDRGNGEKKNIILIPRSAHGTNPATATMAGFVTKTIDGEKRGIITIDADEHGQINMPQLKEVVAEYGERIAGIMVTNPNTSGIFEAQFKDMSDLIHSVDGLVYMDGANMNAIAGWIDLNAMGVDAVHNNLHKTWSIPHGGGGPGDAIVAVSDKLLDYLPGVTAVKKDGIFDLEVAPKAIGKFHRHLGNFGHKVRCYTYLMALGSEGVKKMSGVAVLSAIYLYEKLNTVYPILPAGTTDVPRMHEFILTIKDETFARIAEGGTPKAQAIAKIGKLFLDFGMHAPTVAFPEVYGLMVEPTESFSKAELDRFVEVVKAIHNIIHETPEVLTTVPHFTPVDKVDEVGANKNIQITEKINKLPEVITCRVMPEVLDKMSVLEISQKIIEAHKNS
jgi:glycine dehydrogenase